jgi:ribosomal protein L11 methyltransferase
VPIVPGSAIAAPIVAGARGSELDPLTEAARNLGLRQTGCLSVGRDRFVVELDFPAVGSGQSATPTPTPTPTPAPVAVAVATAVGALRSQGFAVVAGPTSEGHRVAWARRNNPSPFAKRACVCFPWSPLNRDDFELVVEIDPGSGFGAGGHPTTLLLLDGLFQGRVVGRPLVGLRVLDVGCGTGVLGIAAALAGAARVAALDTAPAAMAATRNNVARNGVADRFDLLEADLSLLDDCYDVVLANIHADVLIDLAPHLCRLTAPHGALGLSGLSPSQPSRVEAALSPMEVVRADERDEWVSLWFRW